MGFWLIAQVGLDHGLDFPGDPVDLLRLAEDVAPLGCPWPRSRLAGGWSGGKRGWPGARLGVAHGHRVDLPRAVFLHSPHIQADFEVVGYDPL